MRVVISIVKHELPMAHQWFDWVCELGGTEGHQLHLIPASGTDIKPIFEKANKAFHGQVSIQIDYESETSDWQNTELMRSAAGPNSSFRQVAWDFEQFKKGPWFWCELDCIPTKREWLNRLESEYNVAVSQGKPFMGAHVLIERVREHMSGCAVYPENTPSEAPLLVMRTNYTCDGQPQPLALAFDVAGAPDVLPKAHWTNLIQHKFRYEGFRSREQFDSVIDPNAVVFHSCKDGSIYKYLRENLGGVATSSVLSHNEQDSTPSIDDAGEEAHISSEPASSHTWYRVGEGGTSTGGPIDAGLTITNRVTNLPKDQRPTVESKTITIDDVIEQNAPIRNGLPAMSPPWENREDTERDIKMLCDTLALFAKAPIYKSRVRNALREAKIIK